MLLTHAPCIMCETAVKSGALTLQNDTQSFHTGGAADMCDVKAIGDLHYPLSKIISFICSLFRWCQTIQ